MTDVTKATIHFAEWSIEIEYGTYSQTHYDPEKRGRRAFSVSCDRNKGDHSSRGAMRDSEAEVREMIRCYIESNRDRYDSILGRQVHMTLKNTSFRNDTDLDIHLAAFFGEPEQLSMLIEAV